VYLLISGKVLKKFAEKGNGAAFRPPRQEEEDCVQVLEVEFRNRRAALMRSKNTGANIQQTFVSWSLLFKSSMVW
jgi:hypothetical protein